MVSLDAAGITNIGDANWFIEGAFPMTATRNNGYSLAIVAHTGVAF